jgi:hypothetical protein
VHYLGRRGWLAGSEVGTPSCTGDVSDLDSVCGGNELHHAH